jgi:hypothetical protein
MSYYKEVSDLLNVWMANGRDKHKSGPYGEDQAARIAYAEIIGRLQVIVSELLYNHKDQGEALSVLDRMKKM